MIEELYVDNFRCLTNFTLKLSEVQLLFGANGSGKSSVLASLNAVRDVLSGMPVDKVFMLWDLTAWDSRPTQDFHFSASIGSDRYTYELRVEHTSDPAACRIARERLTWNEQVVYLFDQGEVSLYRVTENGASRSASFPFDATLSFLPLIPQRPDNQPLMRFLAATRRWVFLKIEPANMESFPKEEHTYLLSDASNFSNWYRSLTQEHPQVIGPLFDDLKLVIPGFKSLSVAPYGELRRMEVALDRAKLSFAQLSDGERALIVLYTVLHTLPLIDMTLFVDEPDNYLGLREIQPWLRRLTDECGESGGQAVLISHHPEVMNSMDASDRRWLTRRDAGPTRVEDFPHVDGLLPSETMARGWEQ